ncbi:TrkH family potassium uptake protein [Shimia ponticola]|uniref:TrkH family potassium uptake protein n=1 Tax=Shimia ponticola TaxID=2582893 RepID=UPI0011BEBA32|nr:potassium transporter TrkG [Shimia ponticola]
MARQGAETLLQPARLSVLLLVLAKHGPLAALLFGPPMVWALAEGVHDLALALAMPILACSVIWFLARSRPLPKDLRGVEAMATISILFLLSAVLSVPAFMALGMPVASALFEGMSAVTTTGLSMATNPDAWPFAAHVLRSWMQWCGGLAMATAVLALVLGPGPLARELGKAGIDDRDRITSARKQARELLGAYAALTVKFSVLIAISLGRAGEGLVLALSAISTGGFAPRSDSLASYDLLTQSLVLLACVAGAISLLAYAQLLRRSGRAFWRSESVYRVVLMCVFCAVALAVLLWLTGAQLDYIATLLNLLSAFSTAGYATGPMPASPAVLILFVMLMLVGGDRGSTAGGLKLWRLSIGARAVRHALTLPRLPERAISPLRHRGKPVKDMFLITLIGLFAIYAMTACIVWAMLVSLGNPALPALFDTVSALSTVGLSTGVISTDLPPYAQVVVTLAMWLGRLEFIAVLVLFLPSTWFTRLDRKG